jgi:hypothetical protein
VALRLKKFGDPSSRSNTCQDTCICKVKYKEDKARDESAAELNDSCCRNILQSRIPQSARRSSAIPKSYAFLSGLSVLQCTLTTLSSYRYPTGVSTFPRNSTS